MSSLKQSSILHLPAHLSVCKVTAAESRRYWQVGENDSSVYIHPGGKHSLDLAAERHAKGTVEDASTQSMPVVNQESRRSQYPVSATKQCASSRRLCTWSTKNLLLKEGKSVQ